MEKKPCPVDRGKLLIGLNLCRNHNELDVCWDCPYEDGGPHCDHYLQNDALMYINYLEEQLNAKAGGSD